MQENAAQKYVQSKLEHMRTATKILARNGIIHQIKTPESSIGRVQYRS